MTEALKAAATGQKQISPTTAFSNFIEKFKPQMALALPKHLNADRMARLALSEFSKNPALQSCDHTSIIKSIMDATTLGLEIGVNGQGYLVPYKTTCTFIPGWKGLVDLVNRSGNATVFTGVIFKDQEYTFKDGARRDLIVHNETMLEDEKDITHGYAIGWVKGADWPVIELWRIEKIKLHRDRYNKVGRGHYSFKNWEMYARKVPLLQVLKYMPCSVEIQRAVDFANNVESGKHVTLEGEFVVTQDFDVNTETGKIEQQEQKPEPVSIEQKPAETLEFPNVPPLDAYAELDRSAQTQTRRNRGMEIE